MNILFNRFPRGVTKALTLSFDDGREYDRRLVELFNEYGLKGTFHLNSGFFGRNSYIEAGEVAELFRGHEVSIHTTHHPFLEQSPQEQIIFQVVQDRQALESLVRYPIRGMSYPFGTYHAGVIEQLQALGIEYARTVQSHGEFHMPQNWLAWHPTCHHKHMLEHADKFLQLQQRHTRMSLLYVWGHSYEFEGDNNWEIVQQFGEKIAGRDDIWYATNAEIVAYMKALQQLRFTMDCSVVHNPTALDLWVSVDDQPVELKAGSMVEL
ncbi:polysaccharide deacetylase [Paenibacillus montaniterrae]|uniref:Polysaccharide deacetylase n=1 Tax=Paenibacillus montaniterrae TaxID=429341 RepID=A0A920CZ46_9BACL|nr:polysaccharide deacetylase family protein [Paenibacillus montaniterrae]GIP16659.1 polysaccharide deacetylase [Paenibacillus montaniterrae]